MTPRNPFSRSENDTGSRYAGGGAALAAVIGLLIGFSLMYATIRSALDLAEIPNRPTRLDAVYAVDVMLDRAKLRTNAAYRSVLMGDSLAAVSPTSVNTIDWVDTQLRRKLRATAPSLATAHVARMIYTGLSVYSFYFVADRIVEVEPDSVVIELNLFGLSDVWRRRDRRHIAGLMPVSDWPSGAELNSIGLSFDRVALYRAIVAADALDSWRRLEKDQARLTHSYWVASQKLDSAVRRSKSMPLKSLHQGRSFTRNLIQTPNGLRAQRRYARTLYEHARGGVSEQEPTLRILRRLVAKLESAGIETFVYVPPHNVEYLTRVDVIDARGFSDAISVARGIVESEGGIFVDLHDLLPDSAFRDEMDHLAIRPDDPPAAYIAAELAEHLAHHAARKFGEPE